MVLTGCPVALTPSLEMIQAPGWPGTVVAVNASLGLAVRLTFAPAAAIVVTVWLVGNRFGRTSGVMSWAAAKMARVMAMAGIGRRMSARSCPATGTSAGPGPASAGPGGRGASATVVIGPSCGTYPGQPETRGFHVDMIGLSRPASVLLDGHPLAPGDWTYDPATHTVTVTGLARTASARVTEIGGTSAVQAEPAAVGLGIDPSTPLSLSPGQSAIVKTTEHNAGPGDASGTTVTLAAPSGWTVTPSTPVSAGTIAAAASATQSWTVQAPPSSGTSPETASPTAQATYTSAGEQEQVTATE